MRTRPYQRRRSAQLVGIAAVPGCSERSGTFSRLRAAARLTETLDVFEHAASGKRGKEALEAIAAAYAELR
jgi:hypothetical protein